MEARVTESSSASKRARLQFTVCFVGFCSGEAALISELSATRP